ncbi:hypothetical protein SLEP1_g7042 [Rubroshorea leprosula]|uniref:Glycosyl transferase family 28 C-terminal domain-containing protein n=1 Tax=Rubroshorea leprosula TaxID=152421 RepID=A0AAV5I3F1_9ROSI|nr:hypothetical protein SLEP1_g7042 [Rubroshorea leprosula]
MGENEGVGRLRKVKDELFRRGYTHLFYSDGVEDLTFPPSFSNLVVIKFYTQCVGDDGSLSVDYFTFSSSIADHLRSASPVVRSGGIFETLRLGKTLIVVVNEDLMDYHQTELAEELAERKHLYYARPQTLHQTTAVMNMDSLE